MREGLDQLEKVVSSADVRGDLSEFFAHIQCTGLLVLHGPGVKRTLTEEEFLPGLPSIAAHDHIVIAKSSRTHSGPWRCRNGKYVTAGKGFQRISLRTDANTY